MIHNQNYLIFFEYCLKSFCYIDNTKALETIRAAITGRRVEINKNN